MKILLAEDDDSIRTIADLSLRRVGGHEVVHAQDGNQTLLLVKKERPDLILLDVMMPNLNGFEACKRMKSDPETKDIPIIFLTARAQAHEMQHGISIGALGYILKPFDPLTLHLQIEEILRSHEAA